MIDAHRRVLAEILLDVERHDRNYQLRNDLVLRALSIARFADLAAGMRFDPAEPEWPVAMIELPTGQVSWHLPQHARAWDGHTTEQKYERISRFADLVVASV